MDEPGAWSVLHAELVLLRRAVPTSTLTALAAHPSSEVRVAVSGYRPLPSEIVEVLAGDYDPVVRCRVASLPTLTTTQLMVLASDPALAVRREVAGRPGLPARVVAVLAVDGDVLVRQKLARNQEIGSARAAAQWLAVLAGDVDLEVRRNVAANPLTALDVLSRLALDSRDEVADAAWSTSRLRPTAFAPATLGRWAPALRARLFLHCGNATLATELATGWTGSTRSLLRVVADVQPRRPGDVAGPGRPVDQAEQ